MRERRIAASVPPGREGERLDRFLAEQYPEFSRSRIQRLMAAGEVTLNGRVVQASHRIRQGDRVQVHLPRPEPSAIDPEVIPLDVFFEDAHLLVVNKPPGMAVHPAGPLRSGTLVNALLGHCDRLSGINGVLRPGIVHRLDKDTSGLLAVAKDDAAHRGLASQLEAHTVVRQYLALVWGRPGAKADRVEGRIGRHPKDRKRMAVVSGGRHAVSEFEVLERFDFLSLLGVRLQTGRTHQIRVHMAHIGHPVFADGIYGGGLVRTKGIWPEFRAQARSLLAAGGRQMLHAKTLGFIHPVTGEDLRFEAAPPEDMRGVLGPLGSRMAAPGR